MTRHEALEHILTLLSDRDLALFTTGMISREAFNIRDRAENFYMIGSMGLLNALGLGLALQSPAAENLGHRGGWQRSHEPGDVTAHRHLAVAQSHSRGAR